MLVDHDDWIRPDLLYRYHQTLFRLAEREPTVLIHHESKSRGFGFIEDNEASTWLAHQRDLSPSRVTPQYVRWPFL